MSKAKIKIITGAAGFIGSCLVAYLNEQNDEDLLLVDDLKKDIKWKNLVGKRFIDIISKNDLFSFLEKNAKDVEAIVHLGACSDTLEKDADYLLENNYRYTRTLANSAVKNHLRFIYASSAATYGDGDLGFSDTLLHELRPINMYAYSKHLFDLQAQKDKIADKIVGLKYFNVFGPNEYHKGHMSSMIYKMTNIARNGDEIGLYKSNDSKYTDGGQMRDFIYVKDAVKMTSLFLENSLCGIFNIGSGLATTWNSIAKHLFSALNLDPKIKYIDMPQALSNQYQNYTCADMSKFLKMYPDYKFTCIEDAVTDYVKNYLIPNKTW